MRQIKPTPQLICCGSFILWSCLQERLPDIEETMTDCKLQVKHPPISSGFWIPNPPGGAHFWTRTRILCLQNELDHHPDLTACLMIRAGNPSILGIIHRLEHASHTMTTSFTSHCKVTQTTCDLTKSPQKISDEMTIWIFLIEFICKSTRIAI